MYAFYFCHLYKLSSKESNIFFFVRKKEDFSPIRPIRERTRDKTLKSRTVPPKRGHVATLVLTIIVSLKILKACKRKRSQQIQV